MFINKFKQEGERLTNVEQIIMEKTGINEEQMRKLGVVLQDELVPNGSTTISIDVKKGHGSKDQDVPILFPIKGVVTGTIIAPDEGNWRVVVKNTQKTVNFDESGLKKGDQRKVNYSKGWGTDSIHVNVFWNIEKDTTFVAKIDYQI